MILEIQIPSISLSTAPEKELLHLLGVENKHLALKLMEMGCMPGMQIEKIRTAVGRGPVMIKLLPFGNLLALRFEEAEQLMVQCL
jgi:Fe2+ transport system protein FeoA